MFQFRENIRKESLKCQHYGVNDTAKPRQFYFYIMSSGLPLKWIHVQYLIYQIQI